MLDDIHKRKIDMADEIFVVNMNGYIGSSTQSEIEYAETNGKTVRYLEEVQDAKNVHQKDCLCCTRNKVNSKRPPSNQ